jgi:23S rRNA G2445 N2-methylase RlmL
MEAEVKRFSPRFLKTRPPPATRIDEQTLVYPFDRSLAELAVHYLRTPSRALWDLFHVDAERLEPLYDALHSAVAADDRPYLAGGLSISVEVKNVDRFQAGPLQVRGTVKNAIIDGAEARGVELRLDPARADLTFVARSDGDGLLVSLDLAGASLHLRGWRIDPSPAALKETLAAQMLILSRWDARAEVLLDPMAGTGTIPGEAALAAIGRRRWVDGSEPALHRIPAFREMPDLADLFPGTEPSIVAIELDEISFRRMQDNLRRAGIESAVASRCADARGLDRSDIEGILATSGRPVREQGLILANPPYGVRIGADDPKALDATYRSLRELARATGYRSAFLCGNRALEDVLGRPRMKKPMDNGPITASFLVYDPYRPASPKQRHS